MKSPNKPPILPFKTTLAWKKWLARHHTRTEGVWVKIAKKDSGIPSVAYLEVLDIALCHGWIDGQRKAHDKQYFLQKFTPRRPKSLWSKINCAKVEAFIAAGKMHPAGLKQVESAKSDGRWESAYASQSKMTMPEDFQKALNKNRKAAEFFKTLKSANRYAYLWRIHTAKKPESRSAKIIKLIEMLTKREKFHP